MTTDTSKIDQLIKTHNPFAGHIVVRPQQIWGKSFPDVPSINSHASNAVFDAIDKINRGQLQTVGITITAEKGLGKSHIISRIRHQLQTREDSLFIYMSKYDNLNQIQYQFLQSVTSSLRAFIRPDVMAFQEIAAELINESMGWKHTTEQYISSVFPKLLKQSLVKYNSVATVVETLRNHIEQKKPNITNPYIIQAILWTLSTNQINAANFWLSGKELPEAHAQLMGLPNITDSDKENQALNNVRQILDIISDYRVPVICFDELDIADIADNGFTAAQVIANLSKDLYNNLKKGVVLLAMYPDTWNQQIRVLPQAEAVIDRLVTEKSDRQPIELRYLNSDHVVALVQTWLKEFYQEHQQIPPHPLYPFNENKLRELGKGKPTIRVVLRWCAENFIPGVTPPPVNPVKGYYQSELDNIDPNSFMEDELSIVVALKLAFISLAKDRVELENVKVEAVEEIVTTKADEGYLNFRVVGNNRQVKIGILVLQQSGGKFIGAALKRLINYKKFDFTRGCLIRSKKISSGASVPQQCLKTLLHKQGGEWVKLQSEDIQPLLAISTIYYNCRTYELTEEEIFDFIKQEKIAINNPLIREILSDPSGQEPDNLTDDDLPMRIPQSVENSDDIKLNI
ncbi:hypothetical protein WJM97_12475 [Okeanomitos corallinicola TIOX110]|uniref:KAP NTPase domain-containing protein n=1 Tax=Okeanomitos corallinicola TIOX110 TaxID=3133117 RepID=A0ABZ2UN43_9CYAN